MSQIYESITNLMVNERNLIFHSGVNYSFNIANIEINSLWKTLAGNERAFICTMVAMNDRGTLSYKMKSTWFMSHKTYHKIRKQLLDSSVIMKDGNRSRFILNPDYHPCMSQRQAEVIAREVSFILNNRYRHVLRSSDLNSD